MKQFNLISEKITFCWFALFFFFPTFIIKAQPSPCDDFQCHKNISLTIQRGEIRPIDLSDFLENGICPDHSYKLTIYKDGKYLPLTEISYHFPAEFNYNIFDINLNRGCNGTVKLTFIDCDNNEPPKQGIKDYSQLNCSEISDYKKLPLNVPDHVRVVYENNKIFAYDWTKCGPVELKIDSEIFTPGSCALQFAGKLVRRWSTIWSDKLVYRFLDTMIYPYLEVDSLLVLPNFDDIENLSFDFKDKSWKRDRKNHPDGSITSANLLNKWDCSRFSKTYDDVIQESIQVDSCFVLKKILRKWILMDWCTSKFFNYNQKIHLVDIDDQEIPSIICPTEIIELVLPKSNLLSINANELGLSSNDNCGINIYTFDRNALDTFRTFTLSDTGTVQDIEVWVHDQAGNKANCKIKILVKADVSIGVFDPSISKNIKIYPNPFTDELSIETKDFHGTVQIVIVDVLGIQVWQANILMNSQSPTTIRPTGLKQRAVYTLKLKDRFHSASAKIVKW